MQYGGVCGAECLGAHGGGVTVCPAFGNIMVWQKKTDISLFISSVSVGFIVSFSYFIYIC